MRGLGEVWGCLGAGVDGFASSIFKVPVSVLGALEACCQEALRGGCLKSQAIGEMRQ